MKHVLQKMNFWNLFIGIVIGFGVGIWVINALVPDANGMIRMYHLDRVQDKGDHNAHNPYMMGDVKNEKQFVEDMIKHHEAAIIMATQVLALDPRDEIKTLAEAIIKAQSQEIGMMKGWLANWK